MIDVPPVLVGLEAREMIPELKALLASTQERDRVVVARALCEFGVRDGLPLLLRCAEGQEPRERRWWSGEVEEGPSTDLLPLNALRSPAAWKRLRRTSLPELWRLSPRQAWAAIARSAGLRLEVPEGAAWARDPGWFDRRGSGLWSNPFPTLVEAIDALTSRRPYAVLLEEDRLRVVPLADAIAFWKRWSVERGNK